MKCMHSLFFPGLCLLLYSVTAKAQDLPESLRAAAALPKWVDMMEIPLTDEPPHADVANGEHYLNIELQWHLPTRTKYYRSVVQIVSEAGLDSNGQWTFTFDPEFETQRIHWARIIRDGEVISDYNPETLRLYNTESEMASRLLNGSLTALLILDDLRVGDIIDVASSVEGNNPAFGNEAVLRRRLGWSVPVNRQLNRILVEPGQSLHMHTFQEEPLREVSPSEAGLREWRHELLNSTPLRSEASIPPEVRAYDELQVSSFEDWGAVADWAAALYPGQAELPEELLAEIERIRATAHGVKEQAKAALSHVQGNVRYLGLEMGHGAYQPRNPDLVWQRRFGDCKDKTYLLVRMLKELNIDACPALVHTGWKAGIADFLPSPIAFNHVIVSAEIDGVRYWMDPTYSRQLGSLDTLPVHDYGFALLVRNGESGLTPVQQHPEYRNFVSVETKLTVARPGEESRMEVTTRYGGQQAEGMRNYFETTARNVIGENYTKYWASTYAHPELGAPVDYEEFPESGEVEVREHYRIPDAWAPSDDEADKLLYFTFTARVIKDYLIFPDRVKRKYPYAIGSPVSISEKFEVRLFEPWEMEASEKEIKGPGIRFQESTTWGSVVKSNFHFERTQPVITAGEVLEFEAAMQQINDTANWQLTWNADLAASRAAGDEPIGYDNLIGYLLYGGGMVLSALVLTPLLFLKRLTPPKIVPPEIQNLEGVGGWLILPIFGLTVTPLVVFARLFDESLIWILDQSQWNAVVEASGAGIMALIGFESIFNGSMIVAPVLLLIILFRRRWFLPYLMIGFYALQVVFLLVDLGFYALLTIDDTSFDVADGGDLFKSIVTLLIWGSYFSVSKRVKATFRS